MSANDSACNYIGFIAYISDNGITAPGDPDGVRLTHAPGAKGLEWDTVITAFP